MIKGVPRDTSLKRLTFADLDVGEHFIFRYSQGEWSTDPCVKTSKDYHNNIKFIKDIQQGSDWLSEDAEVKRIENIEIHYDIVD